MKGDDLTKDDYDDIVNIIRHNIGEGALVNESDYISIQYMNDLVLVQAYIDKCLELQKAAESDNLGKINVNSRQDFPNFDPSKQIAITKIPNETVMLESVKKPTLTKEQSVKKQQESVVILKGKRKGKRRIDDDEQFKKAVKNSLASDFELEEIKPEQETLAQKIANKVVGQEDFIDDEEEYEKILQKILKESEQEDKKRKEFERGTNVFAFSDEDRDEEKFSNGDGGSSNDSSKDKDFSSSGQFLVERNKKHENPLYKGLQQTKEDESTNPYFEGLIGQNAKKNDQSTKKDKQEVISTRPKAAFDIGEKISMYELQKKKGKDGQNWACVEAQDYILSVNRDSEELLLSLHSIFPRLALGRLKMFFSLLGENFDRTRQFLMRK